MFIWDEIIVCVHSHTVYVYIQRCVVDEVCCAKTSNDCDCISAQGRNLYKWDAPEVMETGYHTEKTEVWVVLVGMVLKCPLALI